MLAASSNCTTTCARGRAASCRNTSGRVIFAFVGGVGEIRSFFISEPAAGTPAETQLPKPPKGKANAKRQKVEPTTPLEKGRDLKDKLLKKVTSTTTLETQLTSVPYADKLLEEIRADLATFRCFGSILTCRVRFGCFAPPTL